MKYEGMIAADANDLIKQSRPQAAPYWAALQDYSDSYLSNLSRTTTRIHAEFKNKTMPTKNLRNNDNQ